jgi:hypothetical protein
VFSQDTTRGRRGERKLLEIRYVLKV